MKIFPPHNSSETIPAQLPTSQKTKRKKFFFIFGGVISALLLIIISRVSFIYQRVTDTSGILYQEFGESSFTPYRDPDRLNYLLVGIRGEADPEGGLLTDAMVVASIKKSTRSVALISIPRDLWVQMPGKRVYNKINEAYALGYAEGGGGAALEYTKAVATRVCGLALDGATSVNLALVRDFVDAIGGITLTLERPFIEARQWTNGGDMGPSGGFVIRMDTTTSVEIMADESGATSQVPVARQMEKWIFQLPKGIQSLDGNTVLYYIRARFTSTDFDRARREQEVLLAIRNKLKSVGVLLNPVTLNRLLGTFERNVVTDIPLSDISKLAHLASEIDTRAIPRIILHSGDGGLLVAKRNAHGLYILEPKAGHFNEIREVCKNVFK